MKITIEIECERVNDFTSHLYHIIRETKKVCRKNKLSPDTDLDKFDGLLVGDELDDDNCYGTHEVTFTPEPLTPQTPNQ